DVQIRLYAIDNDSNDGVSEYLKDSGVGLWAMHPAKGVSASWNFGLGYLFDTAGCEHVLVVNNDVVLRPDTYIELLDASLSKARDFVTAVSVDNIASIRGEYVPSLRPHPDFSCFLITRKVWRDVGQFDESMVHYCSDGDYHLRMHQAG